MRQTIFAAPEAPTDVAAIAEARDGFRNREHGRDPIVPELNCDIGRTVRPLVAHSDFEVDFTAFHDRFG